MQVKAIDSQGEVGRKFNSRRIDGLKKLCFFWVWGVRDDPHDTFDEHLQELIDFQATNGHLKTKSFLNGFQSSKAP